MQPTPDFWNQNILLRRLQTQTIANVCFQNLGFGKELPNSEQHW
jgi:hypothetical protein